MSALIDDWADEATRALFAADAARTESIRAERAEAANRYFAGHAEVWDQIRSLHVAESEVEGGLSPDTLKEILLQQAIYCGVPAAHVAFGQLRELLASEQPTKAARRSRK